MKTEEARAYNGWHGQENEKQRVERSWLGARGDHTKSQGKNYVQADGMVVPSNIGRPCQIFGWVIFDKLILNAFCGVLGIC